MKVKNGDVIDFLAISWDEHHWEFDHPTVVLKPVLKYSPNGTAPDSMIEDLAIDMACGDDVVDEDVSEEFEWRGWKVKNILKVAEGKLNGKNVWKSKFRCLVRKKIRFVEIDGELTFEEVESQEI